MDSDNKYYDVKTHKGKSFITVSRSVVERYGVAKGDKFILIDNATSMDYAFTVEDICDERGGLMVFMDIDSMRELFGESGTYYNCLVFPVFIPNVTSGINLAFPWYAYVIIFAGVMATYFIITSILVRKLGKITPAEVLKNRE